MPLLEPSRLLLLHALRLPVWPLIPPVLVGVVRPLLSGLLCVLLLRPSQKSLDRLRAVLLPAWPLAPSGLVGGVQLWLLLRPVLVLLLWPSRKPLDRLRAVLLPARLFARSGLAGGVRLCSYRLPRAPLPRRSLLSVERPLLSRRSLLFKRPLLSLIRPGSRVPCNCVRVRGRDRCTSRKIQFSLFLA